MKVLITGGAGYIGTGLVDQLVSGDQVEKIIIYDNLPTRKGVLRPSDVPLLLSGWVACVSGLGSGRYLPEDCRKRIL